MEGILINLDTSFKQFKQLFNERLTTDKVSKLDRLDTAISSRASASGQSTTHSKLNANKAAIDGVRSVANSIKATTDQIKSNPPTGGGAGVKVVYKYHPSKYVLTVSGAGVLRLLKNVPYGTQTACNFRLNVDGAWVTPQISDMALGNNNIAVGGIRFRQFFKIYSVYSTYTTRIVYAYTLGN